MRTADELDAAELAANSSTDDPLAHLVLEALGRAQVVAAQSGTAWGG
ncbi:MAG: hypothetical protein NDI95_02700 [Acidovorax soli]|nr:hypothetical protein [Acidovorax soli]MCM2345549.1 hypothetical protein [Acidovorax soli]